MAIIITASQIYEIVSNEKIIDNNVGGIDTTEDEINKNYGTVSNTIEINLYEWNEDGNFASLDINDFLIYVGNEQNDETYNINIHYDHGTYFITGSFVFNIEKNVKPGKIYLMMERDGQSFSNGPLEETEEIKEVKKTDYNTQTSQIAEIDYNGESQIYFNFELLDSSLPFIPYQTAAFTYKIPSWNYISGWYRNYIRLYIAAENYEPESNDISYGARPKISIDSNELLQTTTTINNKKLSQFIYEKITEEWKEGKELATLKCSIGEYYNEDGTLAISTKQNNLPMLFDIGDLVIPYIAVANGKTEPLSIKLDGTPKVFKVTQIRPYFDGAFWQEITLQEQTT